MQTIEAQLEATLDGVSAQRDEVLRDGGARVTRTADEELAQLLRAVEQSLADEEPALAQEAEKLRRMAEQFREGVTMWQRKAQAAIGMIVEKQNNLSVLVQGTAIRTAARREDLMSRQQQRTDDARERCEDALRGLSAAQAI